MASMGRKRKHRRDERGEGGLHYIVGWACRRACILRYSQLTRGCRAYGMSWPTSFSRLLVCREE